MTQRELKLLELLDIAIEYISETTDEDESETLKYLTEQFELLTK